MRAWSDNHYSVPCSVVPTNRKLCFQEHRHVNAQVCIKMLIDIYIHRNVDTHKEKEGPLY